MDRRLAVRRVGGIILAVNILLAVMKTIVWWQTGSYALGSEAINSIADSIYSIVVLAGLYLTTKPPDFEHPHGHERIEPFVSLFVAAGILAAGVGVLYQSVITVLSGEYRVFTSIWAVSVLIISGLTKFGLYRYCLQIAEKHKSPAIAATALDNRNDILTTAAALIGVLGVTAGYGILDPLAGAIVSLGILYTGYYIIRENVNYLIGAAPPPDLREKIIEKAIAHPEVHGVHDVVAHYVGPEIDVSLHIEVEEGLTLKQAHKIESTVATNIRELKEVDDVFVHVDPKELGEWKQKA